MFDWRVDLIILAKWSSCMFGEGCITLVKWVISILTYSSWLKTRNEESVHGRSWCDLERSHGDKGASLGEQEILFPINIFGSSNYNGLW